MGDKSKFGNDVNPQYSPYEDSLIPVRHSTADIERAVKKAEKIHNPEKQHVSDSGVVRSDSTQKPDYTLIDVDLIERWAVHMTKAVALKGHNNWRNAGPDDAERFKQGAWRHFIAWVRGIDDEDHAAALLFNIAGYEFASR